MADDYRPADYWSERLGSEFSLRGVGHLNYSQGYNQWIYRAKGRALRRALPAHVAGAPALDIGSGVGWVVDQLRRAGYAADGCDITEVAVERLAAMYPDAAFFQLELGGQPIPQPDATYELVTFLDVSYHIVDDAIWSAGLADLARVLRPGGRLLVLDRFGETDDEPAAHVRFRSRQRWSAGASAAGLRLTSLAPAYRWLSRPQHHRVFSRLPSAVRGPVEYILERVAPRAPHMRLATFVRQVS